MKDATHFIEVYSCSFTGKIYYTSPRSIDALQKTLTATAACWDKTVAIFFIREKSYQQKVQEIFGNIFGPIQWTNF